MVEKLDWDSNFFQMRIGRLTTPFTKEQLLNEARFFDLVYVHTSPENEQEKKILQDLLVQLVDEKITFEKKNLQLWPTDERIISYPAANVLTDEEVVRVGMQSSIYSRFFVDAKFCKQKATCLYKTWIINSIKREIAKEFFVYTDGASAAGILILAIKLQIPYISILATDEAVRGKGIGRKLIEQADKFAVENNFSSLRVITQKTNTLACKFYEKNGFSLINTEHIYHYWPQLK